MPRCSLTHARHDRAHCLAPGLFRAIKRGGREGKNLQVIQSFGEKEVIEYNCFEPLGADDLRVLQGLVAMAAISHEMQTAITIEPKPETEVGRHLRESMQMEGGALNSKIVVARGSYYFLAKEIGLDPNSGSSFRLIRACIERLWKVSIIIRRAGISMGFRLLSQYASNEETKNICVGLNPRIATAILGEGQYARISMAEVRAIRHDATRVVHQRICGYLNQGGSRALTIDTLCSYAWPDTASEAGTQRQRQRRIKKTLEELKGLGWGVKEVSPGNFKITRPSGDAGKVPA